MKKILALLLVLAMALSLVKPLQFAPPRVRAKLMRLCKV